MRRLARHDKARTRGVLRQLDQTRELDHRRALAQLTVLADGGSPALLHPDGVADRRLHLDVLAAHDREADVAGAQFREVVLGATRRVGAHHDLAPDK
jgi:hypothetical protein